MIKYNLVKNGDESNLTAFIDGEMYIASGDHPNFDRIVQGVISDDHSVADLFDVSRSIATKFERLSERVMVAHGHVYFDGEEVNNTLTSQILRFMDEGVDNFMPLVNFFEKVSTNPNDHSRENLYRWLDASDFTITPDVDIVGYKAVHKNEEGDNFRSIHSGNNTVMVNGESTTGYVTQAVGDVVEMPRGSVDFNPGAGCSTGLHVGTYEYASSFGGNAATLLQVIVNPRDVVSVPTDSGDSKMRVCRYRIQDIIREQIQSPLWGVEPYDDEEEHPDDEEYCPDCGGAYYYDECDCVDF